MKKVVSWRLAVFASLLTVFACFRPALAAESDPLLRAMSDELERSVKDLRTEDHPPPYFVSFDIKEVEQATAASTLGCEPVVDYSRERLLIPVVRVGSYDTDSSYSISTWPFYAEKMPLDDDYAATRRWIWLNTDSLYKTAVRSYEWKKAYLAAHNIPDRLKDMTHESPSVSVEPLKKLTLDNAKWSKIIQRLSNVFEKYPNLQKSKVSFLARAVNNWYTNSEGTKVRTSRSEFVVRFWASAQAPDGMSVYDYEIVAAADETGLPSYEELEKTADSLAQRVSDLRLAPKGEDYCGPVLFEGQGAAELFGQVMAPNFGFAEDYIGTEAWRNPLKNALGRKILPSYISVTDDPRAKDSHGEFVPGAYSFDDEGVAASKVTLVESGVLKAFCQSRLPTKHADRSNGHSLGGHGVFTVLELTTSKPSSREGLMQKLTELAKDAGLDYVLVVSRLGDTYELTEYPATSKNHPRPYATPSYTTRPSDPVAVYKLYLADGHRELVRGLEFRQVSLRAFRDIQAVGDDRQSFLIEPNDCVTRTLTTPSYVIGELELTAVEPAHSSPPIVPGPLEAAAAK